MAERERSWMMKSKSRIGMSFVRRACIAVLASVAASVAAMPIAARAQTVLQVPTSDRTAGTGTSGYNVDYGSATGTELNNPTYSVFDSSGNQYLSDTGNNCVRVVDSTGAMSVFAGYEATPSSPDTCNAASVTTITPAQGLIAPQGLAISNGYLVIADNGHNCIRKISLSGGANSSGGGSKNLETVVDTCTNYGSAAATAASAVPNPRGLVLDPYGDEIVSIYDPADGISQVVYHNEYPTADPATLVCDVAGTPVAGHANTCPFDTYNGHSYVLNNPTGLAIDPAGNFYLADTGNGCVRELTAGDVVMTPVGQCLVDGNGTTPIANFSPTSIAVGAQGYLYVTNSNPATNQATVLQSTGAGATPTVFAGIPNTASTAYSSSQEGLAAVVVSLNDPTGLSVDSSGNVYVSDSGNSIVRRLSLHTQFGSENLGNPSGQQVLQFQINSAVNLATTTGTDFKLFNGVSNCTGTITPSATTIPTTCSVSLYFDPTDPGLRRSPVTLTDSNTSLAYTAGLSGTGIGANALFIPGRIQTILPSLSAPSATVVDTAGDVYFAETGAGDVKVLPVGTVTPKVFVAAGGLVQSPVGLALDAAQNLYIADNVANAIFKVDANGNVTTFASGLKDPVALVVDGEGNLYVALDGSGAVGVWKIYAGGQQVEIAGQGTNTAANGVLASQAQFVQPSGLFLDANGVLYISDQAQYRVYNIDPSGLIHFFAGNGTQATSDPTSATGVGLMGPSGLTGDAAGDIYIADGPANLVYLVFAGTDQNPGIEALVGTGTQGNSGDNAPANLAQLNNPVSVALDGADDLYLVDAGNNSIREVNYQDPSLIFGDEKPGGTSAPMNTQLWNSGNESLGPLSNFEPQDTTNFAQTADGCGSSLIVGSTCTLTYTFTPAAYGSYETQATSLDNAVDDRQVITLVGNSPQPVFSTPPVTAVYGTAYTMTATFTAATGFAATGTMTFSIGTQVICAAQLVPPSGVVTCSPSPTLLDVLYAGGSVTNYDVTVSYSGDSNYLAATSTLDLTILPIPVTIQAANASRPYDTPNPTFTGTVTPADPFPAGQSITESTYTTTAVLLSPPGTYPISPLQPATAGAGTLISDYAITYVNGTLTIGTFTTPVTFNSPDVTATYGQTYALTTTIASSQAPAPTGTVTFSIGTQTLCANAPLSGGVATCSPATDLVNAGGPYTVTLTYSGDAYYAAAASTMNLTINPDPVTITANNFSRQYDTPNPTFTGTIVPQYPFPTGQSITDTYSTSATLTSPPGSYSIQTSNPATFGTGTLPGNYNIVYIDGTLTITLNASGLTVSSPAVSAVYGQQPAYVLTATVTSTIAPPPTGTVTFAITSGTGAQTLCSNVTLTSGTATCSPSPTLLDVLYSGGSVTPYPVTVTYSGDSNYQTATSNLALTITPIPVMLTANAATRAYGQPNPTFTGTISTGSYTIPTGQSVTASYTTIQTVTSAPGVYTGPNGIVPAAVFGTGTVPGDYAVTNVDGTLTITQLATGPTVTAQPVSAVYSTAYTLSASVTSATTPAPTGTVTFAITSGTGAQTLCANVALSGGSASCAPSPTLLNVLYAGTSVTAYSVTVSYSGDSIYPANATTLPLTITPSPVTITANPATRPFGQANPAFSGTITAQYPIPTGQSISATYATTATTTTPAGVYTGANGIVPTAVYGTGTLAGNYAVTLVDGTLTITQLKTTTFAAPAVNAVYGKTYSLAASISSGTTPAPTGTVTFAITSPTGAQTLCANAAITNGSATCSPSATLLNVLYTGTTVTAYTVTATYSGDSNYAGATTTLALTISPAPVTITATNASRVVDTPNPAFTGTINPANPFPAGQSITATFTTPATEQSGVGNYPIIPAAVAGSGTLLSNYAITLVNGVLSITPPAQTSPTGDFTLAATPPEQEIDHEGTLDFPVTLTSQKNFTDKVSFSCSGLPEGITCSFAPGTLAPAANATATTVMTLTGSADDTNVPPGSFGYLNTMPPTPGNSPAPLILAFTLLPIGFSGSAASLLLGRRRRTDKQGKRKSRFSRWLVPIFLICAGVAGAGLTGCGAPNNFKIYTVTITATDSTYATPVSSSTTVQLVLAR